MIPMAKAGADVTILPAQVGRAAWRALTFKAWLETRTRFVTGLIAVIGLCAFFTLIHDRMIAQWQRDLVEHPEWNNPRWFFRALTDYPFFIWHFLYQDMLQKVCVVFAVLLGIGGLSREAAHGTVDFTLSLPVGRLAWLASRGLVAAVEVVVLGVAAVITLLVCSGIANAAYPPLHAILHVALLVGGSFAFLAASLWISAIVEGEHAPVLVGLSAIGLFYFVLQPYTNGASAPAVVRVIDIARVMAGRPDVGRADEAGLGLLVGLLVGGGLVADAFRRSVRRDY